MDVKIAMQNAGIRIAHSLAVLEMRDYSQTVNDRYAPASGPSCCRAAGSFDDFANPAPDRSENTRSRLHLALAAARGRGAGERQDDRHRRDDVGSERRAAQHRAA